MPTLQTNIPKLSLSLTDSFAVYTRSAEAISPYTDVMNIATTLIRHETEGLQLIVKKRQGLETKSLKEIAQSVFASPLFKVGLAGDQVSANMAQDQARMLDNVSAYLTRNQISPNRLTPGQAYLFSVILVNELYDRQPDHRPTCKGLYKVEEYSPRTGRTGIDFALGVV